jgi:ABC-type transporter Mla MlaB component
MLYANGRGHDARSLLESGVKLNLGRGGEEVWNALFDLYLLSAEREAFENLALDYVVRFEKSPPSWGPIQAAASRNGPTGPSVMVLSGKLTAASVSQMEQAQRLAQRNNRLRLDLTRIQDVDEAGCALLLGLLKTLSQAGNEVSLLGAGHFITTLATKIESGQREKRDIWLLMLCLYQQQGQQDPFEETALQYAITFEESPPSWQAAVQPTSNNESAVMDDGYVLQGEITGGGSEAYAGLPGYAADLAEVVLDLSALRRLDFVSAGMLLNHLTELATKGKAVRLKNVNALVATLFGILGIDQIATIERRK